MIIRASDLQGIISSFCDHQYCLLTRLTSGFSQAEVVSLVTSESLSRFGPHCTGGVLGGFLKYHLGTAGTHHVIDSSDAFLFSRGYNVNTVENQIVPNI